MREPQVSSLLLQLVQVNVGGFALCHKEWPSQPNHMAHQSTLSETDEILFHDAHLELQERM